MVRNLAAYRRVEFRPRVLRGTTSVDTKTAVLGREIAFPLILAPVGCARVADPAGELAVARAAARARIPYALSTAGTRSIEEVAEVSDGRLWFQLFMWRDRGLVRDVLERAAQAGYEALCLTVDSAVMGRRDRDVRRGVHTATAAGHGNGGRRPVASPVDVGVPAGGTDCLRKCRRR